MVELPRFVSGKDLASALERIGFEVVHQRGSHLKMVTMEGGKYIAVIPMHRTIPVGTLHRILKGIADHFELELAGLLATIQLR